MKTSKQSKKNYRHTGKEEKQATPKSRTKQHYLRTLEEQDAEFEIKDFKGRNDNTEI